MRFFAVIWKFVGVAIAVITWGYGMFLMSAEFGSCSENHVAMPECSGLSLLLGFVLASLGFCGLVYCVGKFKLVRDFFAD